MLAVNWSGVGKKSSFFLGGEVRILFEIFKVALAKGRIANRVQLQVLGSKKDMAVFKGFNCDLFFHAYSSFVQILNTKG